MYSLLVFNYAFFVARYENLMQINLEVPEGDEISEIHTKLLRVSILQSLCHSQNDVSKEKDKYTITVFFSE